MKVYVSKYIKLLIVGVWCGLMWGMCYGANAFAQLNGVTLMRTEPTRITRLPMKKQLSLKAVKDKCFVKMRKYDNPQSKITLNQRKVRCLINYSQLGQANAEYLLGKVYAHAHKQFVALDWLKKSFEAKDQDGISVGNPDAGYEIGKMYLDAYLFNHKKSALNNAYLWLRHAGLQGSKPAKVGLARLYFKYRKYQDAYVWYKISEVDHRKIKYELKKQEANDMQFSLSDAQKDDARKEINSIISQMPIKIVH